MGTLITLTADEVAFLAAFVELSPAHQAHLRAAMSALARVRQAGGAQ